MSYADDNQDIFIRTLKHTMQTKEPFTLDGVVTAIAIFSIDEEDKNRYSLINANDISKCDAAIAAALFFLVQNDPIIVAETTPRLISALSYLYQDSLSKEYIEAILENRFKYLRSNLENSSDENLEAKAISLLFNIISQDIVNGHYIPITSNPPVALLGFDDAVELKIEIKDYLSSVLDYAFRFTEESEKSYQSSKNSSISHNQKAADPYNVDDVEVNIVNVPGAKQRQQLDRQMKAVISLAVVAFIIAAIAAGFAIYKNAECRQLRSERNAVQRSLNAVNTQYDDLKEKYDSEIKDREFMFSSNNQNVLELAFYKRYIVCTNDEKYYHQYSCKNFTETKSFRVFTKDDAKRLGYKPCPKCFKN